METATWDKCRTNLTFMNYPKVLMEYRVIILNLSRHMAIWNQCWLVLCAELRISRPNNQVKVLCINFSHKLAWVCVNSVPKLWRNTKILVNMQLQSEKSTKASNKILSRIQKFMKLHANQIERLQNKHQEEALRANVHKKEVHKANVHQREVHKVNVIQ